MSEIKKETIRIHFKDGKTDKIPQKFWDDFEYVDGMFVVKKKWRMDRYLQYGHCCLRGSGVKGKLICGR